MFKKRFSMMTVLVACLCAIVVTLGAIFYSMERITGDALGSFEISQDVSFGPGKNL